MVVRPLAEGLLMRRLGALALVAAAGCSKADSVVVVSVTADPAVPAVTQIRVTMSNAGVGDVRLYPQATGATAISFPTAFSIVVPRARSGTLDLALEGMAGGSVVANGSARTVIVVGGRTDVSVRLTPGPALCGNRMIDPGEECDDANRVSGDGCDFMCHREGGVGDGGAPDVASDIGTEPAMDTTTDASAERADGAGDGAMDASVESPIDAATDLPLEPVEAPVDVLDPPTDMTVDAPIDLPVDLPPDLAADKPPDMPKDAPPDLPADLPPDMPPDAPPDAAVDMPLANGAPCATPSQCASGFCANGVCCDTACNDCGGMVCTCYACNLSGKIGTCSFACTGSATCSSSCGFPMRCCP